MILKTMTPIRSRERKSRRDGTSLRTSIVPAGHLSTDAKSLQVVYFLCLNWDMRNFYMVLLLNYGTLRESIPIKNYEYLMTNGEEF